MHKESPGIVDQTIPGLLLRKEREKMKKNICDCNLHL